MCVILAVYNIIMGRVRRKKKHIAYALDPRETRCPEQAYNLIYNEETGIFRLEYYVINTKESIENSEVFKALSEKYQSHSCDLINVVKDIRIGNRNSLEEEIIKGINTYQQNYRFNKNKGLKEKNSKTLKLIADFDKQGQLLFADCALSSKVHIFRVDHESVTEKFFNVVFPVHKNTDILNLNVQFCDIFNKDNKEVKSLSQVITYAASLATAEIAFEHDIPFMYRQYNPETESESGSIHDVTTNPELVETPNLQAHMDTPMRKFRAAINHVQLVRYASHEELLSLDFVQCAADHSNERQHRILNRFKTFNTVYEFSGVKTRQEENLQDMNMLGVLELYKAKTEGNSTIEQNFVKNMDLKFQENPIYHTAIAQDYFLNNQLEITQQLKKSAPNLVNALKNSGIKLQMA